jgi:predicted RNA-binding Zn-ribbon protein involved in translation (DUF1610 family)
MVTGELIVPATNYEIHCPSCGVLIRRIREDRAKERSCPDCKHPQAIWLLFYRQTHFKMLDEQHYGKAE